MARIKSNLQRIFYPSFDGGLNLSVPPESMNRNELKEAVNVEYSPSTGAMTVRGGLFHHCQMGIYADSAAALAGRRGFLIRGHIMYGEQRVELVRLFTWNRWENVSGSFTGNGRISACKWDGYYLVASGGKLQRLNDRNTFSLETIEGSPSRCVQVFVKSGRVGVVTDENEIRFSAVGDCESWENDPNDDSSAQYLEIGYKDGMNIDAVVPLSRDLIVFKSPNNEPDKGTVFRVTGDFPDWAVVEAAHNTGTFSRKSVQAVGNDVFYGTVSGVASLSAVTAYGEIQTTWPDRKVSAALSRIMSADAELWSVPVKQQLWVKPHAGSQEIWVLDYGRGIWTTFEFPGEVMYADGSDDSVYLLIGTSVYEQVDGKTTDTNDTQSVERTITAKMRMGTLLTRNQVLIRRAFVSFGIQPECRAELRLGDFRMQFSHETTPDYVNDNNEKVYEADKYIGGDVKAVTSRRECIVRGWTATPEVVMTGGGCSLSTMGLEMSEV
ncbi:MAG: hypothetical protein IJL18_04985 [Synergistaceae bacterium]|nr:hypothetical protein [Synergistaceae bacterium]